MQNNKLNEEMSNRTFQQVMDLFVIPAIKKKQGERVFPIPFALQKALVIFSPEGKGTQVKFNDDIHVIAKCKLNAPKNKGDTIFNHEIESLESCQLTKDDDPDCAHILIVSTGKKWLMSFDFRYNKSLSRAHIERANEFIDCAEFSLHKKHWGAFIDNLFSASELLAKAMLLVFPSPKYREKTSHHLVKCGFNKIVHSGNSKIEYVEAMNKLENLRSKGRYLSGSLKISDEDSQLLLDQVKSMRDEAQGRIKID